MNEHLRDRVLRKLDTLSDERGYQVLDYIEFLESKYAERQAPSPNIFTRFSEAVEDRLRAGKISATTIAETMSLMNRAMNALNGVATGVAAAGRSVASDLAAANRQPGQPAPGQQTTGQQTTGQQTAAGSAASAAPRTTGGPGGAPVADCEPGPATPPAPAQPVAAEQGAAEDVRTTESGELDPPVGR